MSVFTTFRTKSIAFSLFLDVYDYKFSHRFNENCLTISIFYSKSKFDHCSSICIVFKIQNQNGPLRSDFEDLAPHFDENSEDRQQSLLNIHILQTREETFPQWIYAFVLNATGENALLIINTVQQHDNL